MRTINYVHIERGRSLTVQPFDYGRDVEYWDIFFNGQSFLYRQIRRLMGALIAAGIGQISQKDVYEMLTIPSKFTYKKISVAPSHGLYLANIEFCEKCFLQPID